MKNRNNKHTIKNTFLFIMILLSVLTMLFMLLISPYQDWDPSLKLIDNDKLLVLRTYWIFAFMINAFMTIFLKSYKKTFFAIYLLLSIFSVIKLISLFLV